jgi:glycosyltransferase involved in cell wall biosynthesis
MPKVSVIIPTYNRAIYIIEAIESVLNQTYKDLEIIVVDDGSTDDTKEVLWPYIESKKIKYLYQTHSGRPSVARNFGIKSSSSEYICFLDSDDILTKESIYERVKILNSYNEVGLVWSNWLKFKGDFSVEKLEYPESTQNKFFENLPTQIIDNKVAEYYIFKKEFVYELFNSNIILTSTVMTRLRLLNQIGMFDGSIIIGEDYDLFLRLGELTKFAFIVKPLVNQRIHGKNITSNKTRNVIEDTKVIEKFVKNRTLSLQIKKRFCKRIGRFYFETGRYFLNKNDRLEARKRFFNAIKYNPYSIQNILYYCFTWLPISIIKDSYIYVMLRWLKRKLYKIN